MPSVQRLSDNHRGILNMLAACACFIMNDTFVKLASADIPIPQIIVLRSLLALPLVLVVGWRQGALVRLAGLREPLLWWRTLGELGGTAAYLSALARLEIANVTAIAQVTPLAATAGAALFMGEKVGWRRWSAIAVGFLAMLLIIRPGMAGFDAWSLVALASVAFIVLRDLTSRALPPNVAPLFVTVISLAALIPLGLAMSPFEPWRAITPKAVLFCLAAAVTLSVAYVFIVQAMRVGQVAVVMPFRYSFLLWAIAIQIAVFSRWPDAPTLLGSAILVATGLYTLYRERKVRRSGGAPSATPRAVPRS